MLVPIYSKKKLKATERKKRIPEFSCVKKETIGIDIPLISRNDDRIVMQFIRIKRGPPTRIRERN